MCCRKSFALGYTQVDLRVAILGEGVSKLRNLVVGVDSGPLYRLVAGCLDLLFLLVG